MSAETNRINARNKANYGAIVVENQIFSENTDFNDTQVPSTSNVNHDSNNCDRNYSNISNAKKIVIKYVERRLQQLQRKNFKIIQFRSHLKLLRKILHLNKNPKKKGYDKFMNDEEKRWLENYYMNVAQTHYEPRWIAGTGITLHC